MKAFLRVLLVVATFAPTAASAASGYVKGRLLFYQNQGGFCPTTRDCTGAQYLQSSFNVESPVSDVKVYLKLTGTSTVLGQSTTDVNGNYVISWYSSSYPVQADIVWHAEHKDGRFSVQTSTGGKWHLWSAVPFNLTNGTTSAAPQDLGLLGWGGPGAPNQVANVYDGAWRTWYFALKYSSRMVSNFTGLSIRAFSNECTTSCANGASNLIHLDPDAAYTPQSRIMHEMGHIASYKSNPFKSAKNYCYPSTNMMCTTNSGWGAKTAEWRSASFEEGLASFIGDVAIYWYNAVAPHNCGLAAAACLTGQNNIETSDGASCATNEGRWQLSTHRFLWDIYDTAQENFIFSGDFDYRPYSEFFDRLASFPNGTGDHQDDEPWNSNRDALDAHDGRSGEDMRYWFSYYGFDPFNQRAINCNP